MADGSVAEKPSLQDARGNIFTGTDALKSNITGTSNIAIGNSAMKNADPGANNTIMIGDLSGTKIIAQNNVGVGHYSLANTTNGMWNTALGMNTLTENVNGNWNAALGMYALQKNLGSRNTGIGDEALQYNTIGENNSALGHQALLSNTLGNNNTSIGMYSMHYNILGNNNVALGFQALQTNTNGSNNIAIGYNADVASNNLSNATAIGGGAIVSASNTIQLGNTDITDVKTSGIVSASGFVGPLTGTASSANILTTSRSINGIAFNGSTDITVTADANTLSNTTLASNVINSSLTSVGTITTGVWSGTAIAISNGGTGSSTKNFVDLNSNEIIGGAKSFNSDIIVNGITIGKGGGSASTNTAIGHESLKGSTTPANNTGQNNTAIGYQSLLSNTSGGGSVAIGNLSLFSNTSGFWNNAVGEESLNKNTTGWDNTSFGRMNHFFQILLA
jgi:hypothetical protein